MVQGKYIPFTTDRITTKGFSGEPIDTDQAVSIHWNDLDNYKSRKSTFYIAEEDCPFQILFGQDFIDSERLFIPNPEANIFSVGGKVKGKFTVPSLRKVFQGGSNNSSQPSNIELGPSSQEEEDEDEDEER